jgi:hypothetical protein
MRRWLSLGAVGAELTKLPCDCKWAGYRYFRQAWQTCYVHDTILGLS